MGTIFTRPVADMPLQDTDTLYIEQAGGSKRVTKANLMLDTRDYVDTQDAATLQDAKDYADIVGTNAKTQEIIGFSIANNSSDANNDIDFITGSVNGVWNNLLTKNLNNITAGTITKRLDANFTAGTNQGGLDTGTKAINSNYYLFIIWKADGTNDRLFSLSKTSPVLPTDYIYFRRLPGFIHTDASGNILGFIDIGDGRFTLKSHNAVKSFGTFANTTRNLVTTILPPDYMGEFNGTLGVDNAGSVFFLFGNTNEQDTAPAENNNDIRTAQYAAASITNSIVKYIKTNNLSQIYYRSSSSAVAVFGGIQLVGYIDRALIQSIFLDLRYSTCFFK